MRCWRTASTMWSSRTATRGESFCGAILLFIGLYWCSFEHCQCDVEFADSNTRGELRLVACAMACTDAVPWSTANVMWTLRTT